MKKIILSILLLAFVLSGFAQECVPVSPPGGRLPYIDIVHFNKYTSDSSIIELYQDTVKFRTNQDAYSFNKYLFIKGLNIAEGGSIVINNDTVLSLDTANIVYKSTTDTITGNKTFTTGILIGADANYTDFPGGLFISSKDNTGHTYTGRIGVIGEANASAGDTGTGVGGVAKTNGANQARGVAGVGKVLSSSDTGASIGGYFRSEDTHTGGFNVGISCRAVNATTNYALSFAGGDISSNTNALKWLLYDNQTSALSFDATGRTGLLKLITTNGAEKVEINGEVDVISTLNSIYGTYNYLTGTYCIGNFNYTTGANSNAIENTAEGYQAMGGAFYTYGIEGTGQYTKTNSYRAIPGIFESTLCDTIFQLDKGATNILKVTNSADSCKLFTGKTYFALNKRIYSPGFTVTGLVNGVVSNTYGNSIISSTLYDDAIAYQGTTDGNGATVALFTSNGDGAIPVIGTATSCDTLLQLNKSTTNALNVANAPSSVKLNSEKDLFEFNKHIATVEVTKAYQTLTYNASVTMNTNIGANAKITLTGNCALTLSNLTNGDEGNIIVIQDGTGSREITISPQPKVRGGDGSGTITLTTTANAIDILSYTYDGTSLMVTYGLDYK
jgi:hypothetical protein